jgi:hypothetical protein
MQPWQGLTRTAEGDFRLRQAVLLDAATLEIRVVRGLTAHEEDDSIRHLAEY